MGRLSPDVFNRIPTSERAEIKPTKIGEDPLEALRRKIAPTGVEMGEEIARRRIEEQKRIDGINLPYLGWRNPQRRIKL